MSIKIPRRAIKIKIQIEIKIKIRRQIYKQQISVPSKTKLKRRML